MKPVTFLYAFDIFCFPCIESGSWYPETHILIIAGECGLPINSDPSQQCNHEIWVSKCRSAKDYSGQTASKSTMTPNFDKIMNLIGLKLIDQRSQFRLQPCEALVSGVASGREVPFFWSSVSGGTSVCRLCPSLFFIGFRITWCNLLLSFLLDLLEEDILGVLIEYI